MFFFQSFVFVKAEEALDDLYEPNPYLRKDKHYLSPLEPNIIKKSETGTLDYTISNKIINFISQLICLEDLIPKSTVRFDFVLFYFINF